MRRYDDLGEAYESTPHVAVCNCFRPDSSDPLGQIPASVKLDRAHDEAAVQLFIAWSAGKSADEVKAVREYWMAAKRWSDADMDAMISTCNQKRRNFDRSFGEWLKLRPPRVPMGVCPYLI